MSDTTTRTVAVLFAAVVTLSAVVVPLGFAEPASAAASSVSSASATDVVVGTTGAEQDISFDVTVVNNSSDTLTVETSALASAAGASVTGASVSPTAATDFSASASPSGNDVEVTVQDAGGNSGDVTGSLTVSVTYDTSSASTTGAQTITIRNGTRDFTTVSGAVVDPVAAAGSAPDITASGGQTQTVSGVTVNTGGNPNGAAYLNVTALQNAGGSLTGPPKASVSSGSSNGKPSVNSGVVTVPVTDDGDGPVTVDVDLPVDAGSVSPGTSLTYNIGGSVGSSPDQSPSGSPSTSFTVTQQSGVTRAGPGGSGDFDTSNGEGVVYDGARVFRGEDDIEFGGSLSSSLVGVSGDAAGRVLSPPLSSEERAGRYTNDGDSGSPGVIVDRPRIQTFEIRNQNGADVSDGTVAQPQATLDVFVEYNYYEAENVELVVEGPSGLEVTNAVADASEVSSSDGTARVGLDLRDSEAGRYNVTVQGSDSLTFDDATDTRFVEISAQDNVGVEIEDDPVSQGENTRFDVVGGAAGDFHLLRIDAGDLRDDVSPSQAATVFRSAGDTREVGYVNGSGGYVRELDARASDDVDAAYAVVEVDDDGSGAGSIDTQFLGDTDVAVTVSDPLATSGGTFTRPPTPAGTGELDANEAEFEVREGELRLASPGDRYVVGATVTVAGNATGGTDDVAIYARNRDDYELVFVDGDRSVPVDVDGEFEVEGVALSRDDGPGNGLLSLPGSYRIGVIDAAGADVDGDGDPDDRLTTNEFTSGTSDQRSIRVVGQSLSVSFPSVVDGQITTQDGSVDVNGTAPGSGSVLFFAVGERGEITTQEIDVDEEGARIDEEDIPVSGLSEGDVTLYVVSAGRDGRVGDGNLPGSTGTTIDGLEDYLVDELEPQGLTASQTNDLIRSQTVNDTASDDLAHTETVQLTDAQTQVTDVYPQDSAATGLNPVAVGDVMVVEGTTNLQPEDNVITVELRDGDVSVGLVSTDLWGQSGSWVVEIDTAGAAIGTYDLIVEDGSNTRRETVELVETVDTPTPTPTEQDTPTPTPTPTATPTPTPTATPTPTPTPTSGGGPGFGAAVALVALLAAALLATRRA